MNSLFLCVVSYLVFLFNRYLYFIFICRNEKVCVLHFIQYLSILKPKCPHLSLAALTAYAMLAQPDFSHPQVPHFNQHRVTWFQRFFLGDKKERKRGAMVERAGVGMTWVLGMRRYLFFFGQIDLLL